MSVLVKLRDVVHAIYVPSNDISSYLNRKTGEIVTFSDDELSAIENDDDEHDRPDWQKEALAKAKQVMESADWLQLPDKFEIHDWAIMESFCGTVEDPEHRAELLGAIRGPGAFRIFRHIVNTVGIEKEWYRFRDETYEKIAKDWLDEHGIEYK